MSIKKLLLVSVGLISLSMNAQAVMNCATDCTKEKACKYSYKKNLCTRDCPDFNPAVVCGTKIQEPPTAQAVQEPTLAEPKIEPSDSTEGVK